MASIEAFKKKIKLGLARPNRYVVQITFPAGFLNADTTNVIAYNDISYAWSGYFKSRMNDASNSRTLSLLCESAELPGVHFATTEDKQWGPVRKIPYLPVYNDLSFVFMCDNYMKPRLLFDQWQAVVMDKYDFKSFFYESYIATVTVSLLNEHNHSIYTIKCFEAYPIEVTTQTLSYGETDTYLKLEVKMAYRYWDMSDETETFKQTFANHNEKASFARQNNNVESGIGSGD
jgi:hypothetical protein